MVSPHTPEGLKQVILDHLYGSGYTLQPQKLFLIEGLLLVMVVGKKLLSCKLVGQKMHKAMTVERGEGRGRERERDLLFHVQISPDRCRDEQTLGIAAMPTRSN